MSSIEEGPSVRTLRTKRISMLAFALIGLVACEPGGKGSGKKSKSDDALREGVTKSPASGDKGKGLVDSAQWPNVLRNKAPEGTLYGTLICDRSLKVAQQAAKDDFTELFRQVCNENAPTEGFVELINSAYAGDGEPEVKMLKEAETNDALVTKFVFGYAIKADMDSPAQFAGLPIYEEFSKGIVDSKGNSRLDIKKESEKVFPGRGSVREITLQYSLPLARGAALFDLRRTQNNNYLLVEGTQDINVTTEHLLDAEQNPYYHSSRSMVFGMKGEPGVTYLVYVTELVVKNRIDPERLEKTILKVMSLCQERVFRTAARVAGKE